MKITKELNVSAQYFYDRVMESVLYDIRVHTKKALRRNQLAGFTYKKQFNKTSTGKIVITEMVDNEAYAFTTETVKNKFEVAYKVEALDANRCRIHYEEKMESFGTIQNLNDQLLGIILGYFRKRNMKKMLTSIEVAN